MPRIKIFFLFLFSACISVSQEADSLLQVYASYPNDTNKINLLYEKAFAFRNTNLPDAIKLAKVCRKIAEEVKSAHYFAKALNLCGILKSETGLQQEAVKDLQQALALRVTSGDTLSQSIIWNNLGNVYSASGNGDRAMQCFEKSLMLANAIHDDRWINGALFSIAELQTDKENYKQAAGNLTTLASWAQEKNDYEILGLCYKNLSLCKLYLGDTAAAEGYAMQALDVSEMTDDDILKCDALVISAKIFRAQRKFKDAENVLRQSSAISQRNQYEEGLLYTWQELAAVYDVTARHKEAFVFLQKHDSALKHKEPVEKIDFRAAWNQSEAGTAKAGVFKWSENVFELSLISLLAFLLIFVLINRSHEQKTQEE